MTTVSVRAFAVSVLLPILLSACGAISSPPLGGLQTQPQQGNPAAVPHVAGTYRGTFTETEGSQRVKGTVTIVLDQSGSHISGSFEPTIKGHTFHCGVSGTVASGPHGARLRYTIVNLGGRNANARGSVAGTTLKGKATVPASGSKKAVFIKYKTKKA